MSKDNKLKKCWFRFKSWRAGVQERQRVGRKIEKCDPLECEERTCMNCGYSFRGHNCPNCGQRADTQRITLKRGTNKLLEYLIGGNSALLKTCGNLLYRPGFMIRDYICGKRTLFFNPIEMLLCLVTIYAIISYAFTDSFSFFAGMPKTEIEESADESTFRQATQMLSNLFSDKVAFSLFFVFVNVLPYKLLFRRRTIVWPDGQSRRLNVAEHFVALVYLTCLFLLVDFILMPLQFIPDSDFLTDVEVLLPLILSTWMYRQIYRMGWMNSLWRNMVANVISLFILCALLILYYGVYYGITEALK